MKKIIKTTFLFFGLLLSAVAIAQQAPPSPIPQLTDLSKQMIADLKSHKASMQKDPTVVYGIVEKILLPHVDLDAMSRSVLGRNAWKNATPDQQIRFKAAFKKLMLRTYAAGMSSYTDETVDFSPIRGGIQPGQNRVEVNSKIIRSDGPAIPVDYRLVYKNNDWQVYDFSVEGISMIESFRSQFANELSQGVDIDTLIKKLNEHNSLNDKPTSN